MDTMEKQDIQTVQADPREPSGASPWRHCAQEDSDVGRMHTDIADDTLQASRQRTFRRAAGKVPGYGREDAREDCNYQLSNKEKKENEEVSIRVLF